jgi:hypothetical protein
LPGSTTPAKTYALSARVLIAVELLRNRVPDVVVRTGQVPKMGRTKQRPA